MKPWMSMLACATLAVAGSVSAQDIRKCVDHGVVGYQNAPCGAGQVDAGLVKLPDYADPPQRDPATAPAEESGVATPGDDDSVARAPLVPPPASQAAFPYRTSIALGMTDDQVLNIPRWGRPARIERTGRRGGWRETWTYSGPQGVRTLTFVEGRLADIGVATPAVQLASSDR